MQIDAGNQLLVADVDESNLRAYNSSLHLQGGEQVDLADVVLGVGEIPCCLVLGQDFLEELLPFALEPSGPISAPAHWCRRSR